ncbi:hypothetical protein PsorP6_014146 [Peronosclerospora sorghi]|uniref:Uncharacterized protein n=1 Tax=Peronosclerospora sorghi TaxID=230839 RepID=A0ACC0VI50_9STRA|nr:hypothetical protein PsorP6_014146 [Peronosclerospora sorghi]
MSSNEESGGASASSEFSFIRSSSTKRKRVVLSIHDKQQVLQRLEEFGINRQQVSDIKKNKERILSYCTDAKCISTVKRKTIKPYFSTNVPLSLASMTAWLRHFKKAYGLSRIGKRSTAAARTICISNVRRTTGWDHRVRATKGGGAHDIYTGYDRLDSSAEQAGDTNSARYPAQAGGVR